MKTIITLAFSLILMLPAYSSMDVRAQESSTIEITDSLIDAVKHIDIVSLNILLAEGADIDTLDQEGNTPLMIASKIGNPRMLRIILAHEPDIHARNNQGETALMVAAAHGQTHVAAELIRLGADVYARNFGGLNSFELASRNGHAQILNLLQNSNEPPYSR